MALDIGRIAYQAYYDECNGKSYVNNDLPKWEQLPQFLQNAWRGSACAVLHYMDDCQKTNERTS